jgi:hypothetical protein
VARRKTKIRISKDKNKPMLKKPANQMLPQSNTKKIRLPILSHPMLKHPPNRELIQQSP